MTHIAERKLAKEVLRQSEDSLRLIIDTIPTMAWTVRPDGVVDFVNQRWLDYTRALILGGGLAISGAPGQGTTIGVRIQETALSENS